MSVECPLDVLWNTHEGRSNPATSRERRLLDASCFCRRALKLKSLPWRFPFASKLQLETSFRHCSHSLCPALFGKRGGVVHRTRSTNSAGRVTTEQTCRSKLEVNIERAIQTVVVDRSSPQVDDVSALAASVSNCCRIVLPHA